MKKIGISVAVVGALVLGILLWQNYRMRRTPVPTPFIPHGDCTVHEEKGTMNDSYLPGILEPGASYKLEQNWYACHPAVDGEVALVRVSKEMPPIVRVIRGVPGDHFVLKPDAKGAHWNLLINGELVKDHEGAPYFFGGAAPPTLSLYVDARGGVLREGEVIVLATRSPGYLDSAALGVASTGDLIGRIVH